MYIIGILSQDHYKKAEAFLTRIRPLLATNDVTIIPTPKNKDFDNQYNLRHDEKIDILKSLTAYDCISIEPNDNPRYPDSEVYKFTKQITVLFYGSPESPNIYLKMYIQECPSYDQVLVISFHKEGMHD